MNRLHPRTSMRRLPPRTTVISGAALGLLAGAAVYGGVASSASEQKPTALKPAAVTAAPAQAARCAPGSTLVKRVCVVHVVRTVVAPAAAAPVRAATRLAVAQPGAVAVPAAKAAAAAKPAAAARTAAPRATPTTATEDDEEGTPAPAPVASQTAATTPAPSAAS